MSHSVCSLRGSRRASPTSLGTGHRGCWRPWFHWTGEVLAMPTFLAAPHVRHAAGRIRALRTRPDVAVTIDTETFPPEVLTLRGRVTISEVEGIPPEYAAAAHRYLGDDAARAYLTEIDRP